MVSTEEILEITDNIFNTMLGSEVTLADDCELSEGHDPLTGCIQISGEWNGAVMVQTTGNFASQAASLMLGVKSEDVQAADIQDTIAELTNMIGGNIKSLVPNPSVLSLPTITTGKEFDVRVPDTTLANRVPLECNGQQLCVALLQANQREG